MRSILAFAALAASAYAQGVTNIIVPSSTPPTDCANSRSGTFQITIQNVTTTDPALTSAGVASPVPSTSFVKRAPTIHPLPLLPRQAAGILTITLTGGKLTDQANRTGYIASNYQFQFDAPPQSGSIYTGGFSLCSNGSLSLGGSAVFYQCLSGTFYNLYDRPWAEHCVAVYILAIGGQGGVYSTLPPGPVSTGPSEATIANGGGTQSMNQTTGVGIGEATSSSRPGSASATATGSGSEGSGAAESTSSDGAAKPTGMERAQKMLGWALGMAGLAAMV